MPPTKKVTKKTSTKKAEGLSERDRFAAEALMGLLSSRAQNPLPRIMAESNILAATAYVIADQMMDMRQRPHNQLKAYISLQLNQKPPEAAKGKP